MNGLYGLFIMIMSLLLIHSWEWTSLYRFTIEIFITLLLRCITKVKKDLCPSFMKEIFIYDVANDKFIRPNVRRVDMGEKSLRSFGPIIWNTMLPDKMKSCPNVNVFKATIKSWIPDNCRCKLCKVYVPQLGYVDLFE